MSDQRWPEPDEGRLRFAAARAEFLGGGDSSSLPVPDIVAASWRRSAFAGVDATRYHVRYHSDIDVDSRLARCARPILERLTRDMSDVPASIALTDSRARVIERRDRSTAVGRVLDRVDFSPGYSFEEDGVGTNGVGTVFETRQPVSVVGAAHFNESLVPFACTGAPILDPLSGRIEGVLDVSMLAESWNPLIHALVRGAAGDIAQNLLLDRSRSQQALFEAYMRADSRTPHAVMAVGDTVMVNRRAQQLLSAQEQSAITDLARYWMTRNASSAQVVALPTGRHVRVRVRTVSLGSDVTGLVLQLSEATAVPTPTGSTVTDALPANKHSAVWRQAITDTDRALRAGGNILLTGEIGAGRASLVSGRFHHLHPDGQHAGIDATALAEGRIDPDIPSGGSLLLVLRNIDAVPHPAVEALVDVLAEVAATAVIAATAASGAWIDPHLSALFDHGVTVPALRFRSADLPRLIDELLAELTPGRRNRISPAALRVLTAHAWPGNIPHLRAALAETLEQRPAGEITVDDLPGYCRSTTARRLTAIEVSERDTIVAALDAASGNRLQAAAALGISRSSLYRKLKAYGITDA